MSANADGGGRETSFTFLSYHRLFFEGSAPSNSAQGASPLTREMLRIYFNTSKMAILPVRAKPELKRRQSLTQKLKQGNSQEL